MFSPRQDQQNAPKFLQGNGLVSGERMLRGTNQKMLLGSKWLDMKCIALEGVIVNYTEVKSAKYQPFYNKSSPAIKYTYRDVRQLFHQALNKPLR